jgi:hypothetical protein
MLKSVAGQPKNCGGGLAAPLTIEKAFGVSMDALMRMQNSFDIA